ncbi:hypothetical protein IMG5_119000 [Ichthyophthirius multifiliis]|uniref:Uncharacterized protein n=1 Tax=Ichthyophthirius multifiliis TaxID=5932 RepID=G0QUS9_ICHMU|nr:hypothetical protein IMG5_119000 [Ichthyophthirius multifiliis]EGR31027.1 hypothetical protein IMG5_119000 [Ichthyophthirius multifiliis]|eukprot:XP_004034513.1 hypothetical protein IMG5_119000 [Ichthyophthirius multifiliis]
MVSKKKLAVLVSSNPSVIQLNFNPSGKGHSELEEELIESENYFYQTERENKCVVCGQDEKYTKFYIVPSFYRRHFPVKYKSHRSFDVLLLCLKCHEKAGKNSERLKAYVLQKYSVQDNQLESANIIKNAIQIQGKIEVFSDEYFGINKNGEVKINEKFIQYCLELDQFKKIGKISSNKEFKNQSGKYVVEQLKSEHDIKEFIKMWRKNFVQVMQPKFLPPAWTKDGSGFAYEIVQM